MELALPPNINCAADCHTRPRADETISALVGSIRRGNYATVTVRRGFGVADGGLQHAKDSPTDVGHNAKGRHLNVARPATRAPPSFRPPLCTRAHRQPGAWGRLCACDARSDHCRTGRIPQGRRSASWPVPDIPGDLDVGEHRDGRCRGNGKRPRRDCARAPLAHGAALASGTAADRDGRVHARRRGLSDRCRP